MGPRPPRGQQPGRHLSGGGTHLAAIGDHGLASMRLGEVLIQPKGERRRGHLGPVDLVIFAVKLYDTPGAGIACLAVIAEPGVHDHRHLGQLRRR